MFWGGVCAHECRCLTPERLYPPEAGVTGGSELPGMAAGS